MRILHTSDWHLGLSTGPVSRIEDQRRFLEWLTERLRADQVDALVVAGDVFDSVAPSAEAQSTYYRFLAGLPATGVGDVVIVGGNHDSASRLEAPREVLAALDVHVVGGLPPQEALLDSMIVPLRGRGGDEVRALCLAVPFVHEYRLGIRTTELDRKAVAEAFRERFTGLYARLADRAEELAPGTPLVATGHLVLGDATGEGCREEIHQVGFIGALPTSVLGSRPAYVALGHIHHARPVVDGRAWYCGSPIPLSASEDARTRKVLEVDLSASGEVAIAPIAVPPIREVRAIHGTPAEIEEELRGSTSDAPLPTLLVLCVRLDGPDPGLRDRLHRALEAVHPEAARPIVVEVRETFAGPAEDQPEAPSTGLEELTVREVFARLCRASGVADGADLEQALATLESMTDEDFEARVEDARSGGGPEA